MVQLLKISLPEQTTRDETHACLALTPQSTNPSPGLADGSDVPCPSPPSGQTVWMSAVQYASILLLETHPPIDVSPDAIVQGVQVGAVLGEMHLLCP